MSTSTPAATTEHVAVVLSGAAARGAFQAGALAELIPALTRQGLRPTIWLGTSAGSINAALWGALAHLDAEEAADQVTSLWRRMSDDAVFRPLLPFTVPRVGLQYAAGALLDLGTGTTSLLDTTPLRRTAAEELSSAQLAANVRSGLLDAVGVVTTRLPPDPDLNATPPDAASSRSVLFLDEHEASSYDGDDDRALDVVRGPIGPDHVLASSAIPAAFPPVRITEPSAAAGWYADGGVRLNTPLQPAIGLGATKIVVVSAAPTDFGGTLPPAPHDPVPDIADSVAQVLNAVLSDRTAEDLRTLRMVNRLVEQSAAAGQDGLLGDPSGRPYRKVEVMAVAPPPGELGELALRVHHERTSGFRRLTELDNWLLGRLVRGAGDGVGRRELLSYFLFDEAYFAAGIEVGRKAAADAWARGWQQ